MPNDALDIELCHTIRTCWQNGAGIIALKGLAFDKEVLDYYKSLGVTVEQIILGQGVWGCGDSSSRLCRLLVNEELNDYATASDAISLSDTKKLAKELIAMKMTTGSILVRINVLGGASGSGHSYIFLGLNRLSSNEALDGHIYQTNIGCAEAFDLNAWIGDDKYKKLVNLEAHFKSLATDLFSEPVSAYEREYMLTGGTLNTSERTKKTTHAVAGVCLMWRQIDPNIARANLKSLRNLNLAKAWPAVTSGKKAHLTV